MTWKARIPVSCRTRVNGSQRNLGAHFPGVPALASHPEVTGGAHRKAVDGGHAVEAVLLGTTAKGVEKEEKARSQGDDQQADSYDAAHPISETTRVFA